MGNTLGAMVFLAAATYLGWTVVRGRAQSFLAAASGGSASGGGSGGGAGASPPAPVIGGSLAGVPFTFGDQLAPTPNVFGDVFGQNGSLNSPQSQSPYSPAPGSGGYTLPSLGPWSWLP